MPTICARSGARRVLELRADVQLLLRHLAVDVVQAALHGLQQDGHLAREEAELAPAALQYRLLHRLQQPDAGHAHVQPLLLQPLHHQRVVLTRQGQPVVGQRRAAMRVLVREEGARGGVAPDHGFAVLVLASHAHHVLADADAPSCSARRCCSPARPAPCAQTAAAEPCARSACSRWTAARCCRSPRSPAPRSRRQQGSGRQM